MTQAGVSTGRVLVTGASGFMGGDLVAWLAREGWLVRAAARNPARVVEGERVEAVALGDLSGAIDWGPLLDGVTHVVHLAGIAHATHRIPEATYQAVNAQAVRDLAIAARAAKVRRVVMMSSIRAQCGPSATGILTETRDAEPIDAYGRSKLSGERALAAALDGGATDWCVLRPVVVYGPNVKGNMATLAQLAHNPLPLPLGGLQGQRSILGLANLQAATLHGMNSAPVSGRTFIVADPGSLSVPAIVAAMRAGLGRPPGIIDVPLTPARLALRMIGRGAAWDRIAGDLVVSTGALEAAGWRPVESSQEGLARWMRESSSRPVP